MTIIGACLMKSFRVQYGINLNAIRKLATQTNLKIPSEEQNESLLSQYQLEWETGQPYEKIPGPSILEVMRGFLPGGRYYRKPMDKFQKTLKEEYGSIVRLPGFFGKRDMVITFEPNDFEKVFRTEGIWPTRRGLDTFEYYRTVVNPEQFKGAVGLSVVHGEDWANMRTVTNPVMMQPKTVRIYVPRMNEVVSEFVENIRNVRDRHTLEAPDTFQQVINNWTLESICLVALDTHLGLLNNATKNPDVSRLNEAVNTVFELLYELDIKPSMWKIVRTPKFNRIMKAFDTITSISVKYVDEAVEKLKQNENDGKGVDEGSVLERLLKIDKRVAVTMAMDLLLAGTDTTTSGFVAVLLSLAKNPEKQEILRQEIKKILPDKNSPMTNENMLNLPYLRACIKEGLRTFPVTSGNFRTAGQDIVLSGYKIPKGTDVVMANFLLLKDDAHFARSKEFIPERWLRKNQTEQSGCPITSENGRSSNPFAYLPFGFGPRMCIGKRFVDMELEIGLAKIIRNFHVEFNYPIDNVFKTHIINVPDAPLKFKFVDVD